MSDPFSAISLGLSALGGVTSFVSAQSQSRAASQAAEMQYASAQAQSQMAMQGAQMMAAMQQQQADMTAQTNQWNAEMQASTGRFNIEQAGMMNDFNISQQMNTNRMNADIMDQTAAETLKAGNKDLQSARRNFLRAQGDTRAAFGASGVMLEGSPVEVLGSGQMESDLEKDAILYGSQQAALRYTQEGIMKRYQNDQLQIQGDMQGVMAQSQLSQIDAQLAQATMSNNFIRQSGGSNAAMTMAKANVDAFGMMSAANISHNSGMNQSATMRNTGTAGLIASGGSLMSNAYKFYGSKSGGSNNAYGMGYGESL